MLNLSIICTYRIIFSIKHIFFTHFRMAAMAQIDFSIMGVYNDHNRLLPDFEGKN